MYVLIVSLHQKLVGTPPPKKKKGKKRAYHRLWTAPPVHDSSTCVCCCCSNYDSGACGEEGKKSHDVGHGGLCLEVMNNVEIGAGMSLSIELSRKGV